MAIWKMLSWPLRTTKDKVKLNQIQNPTANRAGLGAVHHALPNAGIHRRMIAKPVYPTHTVAGFRPTTHCEVDNDE